jgi:HTH-type transcriptional regulator / antitoxin HipB
LLRQARESAGVTQEEVAGKLNTKKSAISRIENHAEDIRLSTLRKYAEAIGKELKLEVA